MNQVDSPSNNIGKTMRILNRAVTLGSYMVFLAASAIVIYGGFNFYTTDFNELLGNDDMTDTYEDADESYVPCNVSGIELHGMLVTYISESDVDEDGFPLHDLTASEHIIGRIQAAEDDDEVKAIILEVDSLGGWPVADEEVANALKRAQKPTVTVIRGDAQSAGYYAATGADWIIASLDSSVGSIGVTGSYTDNALKNEKEGLTYNELSSGKFKSTRSEDKPLTDEERTLLMRDINIMHENFIQAIARHRGLEVETVRALADGSSMLGQMALDNGLIDQIGSWHEAEEYLKELIGEEVEICW